MSEHRPSGGGRHRPPVAANGRHTSAVPRSAIDGLGTPFQGGINLAAALGCTLLSVQSSRRPAGPRTT